MSMGGTPFEERCTRCGRLFTMHWESSDGHEFLSEEDMSEDG